MSQGTLKRHIVDGITGLVNLSGYNLTPNWRLGRLPLARHLRDLFATYEVDCVFDVGANLGQYRDMLREESGFSARILSFEPVKKYAEVLKERAKTDQKWTICDFALGNDAKISQIHVTKSPGLNSFLAPRRDRVTGFWADDAICGTEAVETRTLDDVYQDLRSQFGFRRPYLKIDTQGFDMEVLKGAKGSIETFCGLQTEASIRPLYDGMPDYREMIGYLASLGYSISGLFPVWHDPALRMVEFDCVMVSDRFAESLPKRP